MYYKTRPLIHSEISNLTPECIDYPRWDILITYSSSKTVVRGIILYVIYVAYGLDKIWLFYERRKRLVFIYKSSTIYSIHVIIIALVQQCDGRVL